MQNTPWKLLTIILALALLAACAPNAAPTTEQPAAPPPAAQPPTETPAAEEPAPAQPTKPEPAQTAEPEPVNPPLPPEPQPISIPTVDGRMLEGFYYPGAYNPGPTIILMHWAPGTLDDWDAITPWLQNRKGESTDQWQDASIGYNTSNGTTWLDEAWFPQLPEDVSFNVIVFNFGGYGSSTEGPGRASLIDDALAVLQYAAQLEGVDPDLLATAGASIGADGAADSCYLFNQDFSDLGSCLGAFSLSPGHYLTMPYDEAVNFLDLAGVPVWCLAAEGDGVSPKICRENSGSHYQFFIYAGGDHGMRLVSPEHKPADPEMDKNTLEIMLLWIETIYGYDLMQ